jgi:hypothetical protein
VLKDRVCSICSAAICLCVLNGSLASASMVTYSSPIPASDGAGHNSLPTSASFSLPEFNPALGTLTGIAVKFALSYQGEVDVSNLSGSPQTASGSSSVPVNFTAPSSGAPSTTAAYSVTNVALTSTPPLNEFLGPVLSTNLSFNPLAVDFGLYEGVGNSNYQLAYGNGTYSGSSTAPGGTVFFGGDANSSGTASVVYTFSPAPEPASMALLGSGLLAVGGLQLRRRRRA